MRYRYAVTVSDLTPPSDGSAPSADLGFEVASHDDWHAIVEKMRSRALFDETETTAFCVGLKLLGGVLLNHRDEALFKDFSPAFGTFVKTLKRPPT